MLTLLSLLLFSCENEPIIPNQPSNVSGIIKRVYNTYEDNDYYDYIYTNGILDSVILSHNGVPHGVILIDQNRMVKEYRFDNDTDIRYYYSSNLDSVKYIHDNMTISYTYLNDTIFSQRSDGYQTKLYRISNTDYILKSYWNNYIEKTVNIKVNQHLNYDVVPVIGYNKFITNDIISIDNRNYIRTYSSNGICTEIKYTYSNGDIETVKYEFL